jgi:tetratricopeptide (TPR) repeat protein
MANPDGWIYVTCGRGDCNYCHANHNFGLLTRQINGPHSALSFLEKALKTNKNIEQYWLIYIETLLELNEIDKASSTIDEAKKNGINEEKVAPLCAIIAEIRKTGQNPLAEIQNLIKLINENKDDHAEIKAK